MINLFSTEQVQQEIENRRQRFSGFGVLANSQIDFYILTPRNHSFMVRKNYYLSLCKVRYKEVYRNEVYRNEEIMKSYRLQYLEVDHLWICHNHYPKKLSTFLELAISNPEYLFYTSLEYPELEREMKARGMYK